MPKLKNRKLLPPHILAAPEYHGMSGESLNKFSEVTIMCGNNFFGGNNCWWIIILILLISCCGCGNNNGNWNSCGCDNDRCNTCC